MELFIVIVIVVLSAGYIIKNFYNKYQTGKAGNLSCGCKSCDATDQTCSRPVIIESDR